MGRESSDGEDSALGYLEDQSGFGLGDGPVPPSSTHAGGAAVKHKTKKRGAGGGRAATPRLSAAESASLFADFDFNGLGKVRDAYGRDITPVTAQSSVVDSNIRGSDGDVHQSSAAAHVVGGGAASVGIKVTARARVPAQVGDGEQGNKFERSSKGGGANYACTAEC